VCQLHQQAYELLTQGIHLVSTDEMTGIQALERLFTTQRMKLKQVEKIEFEYIRHGTQTLIANWHIAKGKVLTPSIGATRTAEDFVQHIAQTVDTDPDAGWIFIVDQLNIHKSESLVRLVAQRCQMEIDLGIKEKSGILQSMSTRAAFLSDSTHRIRFVYIPKHTSWLNQIECWFSILMRRFLKRSNFTSTDDLKQKILEFISYYNRSLAKPFLWKFQGYPEAT
jgi:putative transposase